jgi:hypothetical protein
VPYILTTERFDMDQKLDAVPVDGPGALAYAVTRLCQRHLNGRLKFANLALVVGVLVCVTLELYRRVIAPYEDTKRAENGDVFEYVVSNTVKETT